MPKLQIKLSSEGSQKHFLMYSILFLILTTNHDNASFDYMIIVVSEPFTFSAPSLSSQ